MSNPSLSTEAGLAGQYPSNRFNQRERKLLASVKDYVDAAAPSLASHVIKYAAQRTTVGGAAAEAITVTGALATDLAFVQIKDNGTGNVTILQAALTSNTLTVTFSGDPGADTIIYYQIVRAA
jgi:hypothetical protein